jgi:hypothetical protein
VRNEHGYGVFTDRITGKVLGEHSTFRCIRCHYVTRVPPFCDPASLGGIDARTNQLICARCVKKDELERKTWEEKIYQVETELQRNGEISIDRMNAILDGRS